MEKLSRLEGLDAAAATIAVVVASSIFGSLHNYCPGYGLIVRRRRTQNSLVEREREISESAHGERRASFER